MTELRVSSGTVRWALVVAVAALVFAASVVRPSGAASTLPGASGLVSATGWLHAVAYATLAVLVANALRGDGRPDWVALGAGFALATAYGAGIELVQSTLAYRAFETADLLVNTVAAALSVVLWRILGA
ncbi:VanZ like family protein [Haloplanus vescus]|uniref:VanZ like family protein n=1 Tax=Haloplanus vescus TaxID=555874 RepID=A0A1H3WSF2_9EURY|nr:VanZ family protein [Haloplanus vescus]SDZ89302.1 VanZ like family protein [Haloplanus vescus]